MSYPEIAWVIIAGAVLLLVLFCIPVLLKLRRLASDYLKAYQSEPALYFEKRRRNNG